MSLAITNGSPEPEPEREGATADEPRHPGSAPDSAPSPELDGDRAPGSAGGGAPAPAPVPATTPVAGSGFPASTPNDDDALDAYSQVVMRVAERLLPSVASLRVMGKVPGGRMPRGGGSAVVLTADGLLITSAHVVNRGPEGPSSGTATFPDGRELDFEPVGADRLSDLAVLRVDANGLTPADIGDADQLRVGQLVVAVGSPLGYAGSVSAGVVSAVGRSLTATSGQHARIVENVIQTDAALHPGNSGGALAIGSGKVVGINTAVVSQGVGQGLGLAIPLNRVTQQVLASLIDYGRVRRAFLGIAGGSRPLPPRALEALGRERGFEITSVTAGSPAAKAGLVPEDVVVGIDDEAVSGIGDIQRLMVADRIGRPIRFSILRQGATREIDIVPTELPHETS